MTGGCSRCGRRLDAHASAWVDGVRVDICPQAAGHAVEATEVEHR